MTPFAEKEPLSTSTDRNKIDMPSFIHNHNHQPWRLFDFTVVLPPKMERNRNLWRATRQRQWKCEKSHTNHQHTQWMIFSTTMHNYNEFDSFSIAFKQHERLYAHGKIEENSRISLHFRPDFPTGMCRGVCRQNVEMIYDRIVISRSHSSLEIGDNIAFEFRKWRAAFD